MVRAPLPGCVPGGQMAHHRDLRATPLDVGDSSGGQIKGVGDVKSTQTMADSSVDSQQGIG